MIFLTKNNQQISFNNKSPVSNLIHVAQNQDLLASLRRLGLNQYEAKSYYALASTGKCTAGELSTRAELPRPRVYDVLTSLSEKGFVEVQPSRPVLYRALPLSEAVKSIRRQRQNQLSDELTAIEEIACQITPKISLNENQVTDAAENVWTLRGKSALYSRLASMLEESKKHILISSTPNSLKQKISENFKLLEKAKGRGVKISVASTLDKSQASEISKLSPKIHGFQLPTRMVIADDQALIFLTGEQSEPDDEVGLWIHNPHVASTLRQLFPDNKTG